MGKCNCSSLEHNNICQNSSEFGICAECYLYGHNETQTQTIITSGKIRLNK
jgi:hypothetical protein